MSSDKMLTIWTVLVAVFAFNFLPTAIAYATRHPERRLLASLNILSLLSFLLWFALLAWAAGGKRDDSVIGKFVSDRRQRRTLGVAVAMLVAGGLALTINALRTA